MLQNLLLTNRIQAQTAQNTLLPVISTVRNYWCEVVQEYQQADGKIIYEDPEKTQFRLRRADQAEGINRRRSKYQYYEKPWMRRKRLKENIIYRANKEKVDDLTRWIVFRQQNNLPIKGRKEFEFDRDDNDE